MSRPSAFIATIEDPVVVQRILRRVALLTDTPEPAAARPPGPAVPLAFDFPPEASARIGLSGWHVLQPVPRFVLTPCPVPV